MSILNDYIGLIGNGKKEEEMAILLLPFLIKIIKQYDINHILEPITYKAVENFMIENNCAKKQWSISKFYGDSLGKMSDLIAEMNPKSKYLNSLVINANGIPGNAFFEYHGLKVKDLNKIHKSTYLKGYQTLAIELPYIKYIQIYEKIKKQLEQAKLKNILTKLNVIEKNIVTFNISKNNSASKSESNEKDNFPKYMVQLDGIKISEQVSIRKHLVKEGRISAEDVKKIKKYYKNKNEDKKLHCHVCGMVFEEQFGLIGLDFIELHHLKPYSTIKEGDVENKNENDFCILCSNCHSMIHRLPKPKHNQEDIKTLQKIWKQHN